MSADCLLTYADRLMWFFSGLTTAIGAEILVIVWVARREKTRASRGE